MNGDILTKADFSELYRFANQYTESALTIITKVITTPFRFGNISSDGVYVTGVDEKPDLKFEILSGMYIMKPEIFNLIPFNEYYGMDTLIKHLLEIHHPLTKIITRDYWLDIGIVEDYEKAREIYDTHFKE